MNKIKKNIKWIFLILASILFILLLQDALQTEIMSFDDFFHYHLVVNLRNDFLTQIMKSITFLASPLFLIIITIVVLIYFNDKRKNTRLIFNLGFVTIINQLLKHVIKRSRPIGYRLIEETGFSFPSGHSMVSLAFYGYFIYLIWKSHISKKYKILFSFLLSILILAIGLSRIYLGVHYASDVFAGMSLSLIYLIIYTTFLNKIDMKKGE